MKEVSPIFVNAFSRAGSNLIWNVFLTHPDVCSPIKETVEIFRTGRGGRVDGYLAIFLTRQWRFFHQKYLEPRREIGERAQVFIDGRFHEWKLRTLHDAEMRFKTETEVYSRREVATSRLCAKNTNGLVFLNDILRSMYPGARFVVLVKNPTALYESYRRVRFFSSVDAFVPFYCGVAAKMLEEAERGDTVLIRFEDFLSRPRESIRVLYDHARLDTSKVQKMRFKAKVHYTTEGQRGSDHRIGRHHWFDFDDLGGFLEPNVNTFHMEKLTSQEIGRIQDGTKDLRTALGYD